MEGISSFIAFVEVRGKAVPKFFVFGHRNIRSLLFKSFLLMKQKSV